MRIIACRTTMYGFLNRIIVSTLIAIAVISLAPATALARLSEPDVVYYGTLTTGASGNTISLRLSGSSTILATCALSANLKYILRIPMDAYEPRTSGTALTGDAAEILNGSTVIKSVTIPARGTVVKMDIEPPRTEDQWKTDHPGDDGSGDLNRNGVTDLAEYLSGGDPAACVWTAVDATHAETTVYNARVLSNCLNSAGGDQRHNLIRLARGSYSGNFSYIAAWGENYDLNLVGGYNPSVGSDRLPEPSGTVLNGDTDGDGAGNGITLAIDTNTNKSGGAVHVESLAIRNGVNSGGNGGGVQAYVYQGGLELVGNMFSGNTAGSGGGVSLESSDSGQFFLTNNIFYGNSASGAAALRITSSGSGAVTLLNNTIADNTAGNDGEGRSFIIESSGAAVELINNIWYGSSSVTGDEGYVNSSGATIPLTVSHNVFLATGGLYTNRPSFTINATNINGDPGYVASLAGNFHLRPVSAILNRGVTHTKLPATDAGGAARQWGTAVDPGAYEFHGATTNAATNVTHNSATLNGQANANGADTTLTFQYGHDTSYSSVLAAVPATLTGVADTAVSASLTGLSAGVYHYRIVATSSAGIAYGADQSFSTFTPALTMTVSGSGSVHGVSAQNQSYACSAANCPATPFTYGDQLTITATPATDYRFSGWSGACSSLTSDCSLTLTADRSAGAAFTFVQPLRLIYQAATSDFGALAEVYAAIADNSGAILMGRNYTLSGGFILNRPIDLVFTGGYDTGFSGSGGYTTLSGGLTIGLGSLTLDRLVIY